MHRLYDIRSLASSQGGGGGTPSTWWVVLRFGNLTKIPDPLFGGMGCGGGGGLNILYGECELRDKLIELSICAQFRDCGNMCAKNMSNICAQNVQKYICEYIYAQKKKHAKKQKRP